MQKVLEAIRQIVSSAVATDGSPLNGIKSVYFGDPISIPESSQPAIVVHPISTVFVKRGSRYDRKLHTVEVRFIDNKKNYEQTSPKDAKKVVGVETAVQRMEETTDPQKTKTTSLCGLIQTNPTLEYVNEEGKTLHASIDANVVRVDYTFSMARGFPTFEVIVTIEALAQGDRGSEAFTTQP